MFLSISAATQPSTSLRSSPSFRKLNSAADLTVASLRDVTSRYIVIYAYISISKIHRSIDDGNNYVLIFFEFPITKSHRLTDFRGKRPPLSQEFERYNSSSPTWRPSLSRSCTRVHTHTYTIARARHVETRHRFSNDRTTRERENKLSREEKEGFEASRIEQI